MNTETPLTDAEYASHPVLDTQTGGDAVRIQFARKLERDYMELRGALHAIVDLTESSLGDSSNQEDRKALKRARTALAKCHGH